MNILIADDDRFLTKLLRDALDLTGHTCSVCESAEDLLRIIERPRQHDCLLLDLMMRKPENLRIENDLSTGEQLLKIVKRKCPSLPVVVITGKDPSDISPETFRLARGVIYKPFDADLIDLRAAIEGSK